MVGLCEKYSAAFGGNIIWLLSVARMASGCLCAGVPIVDTCPDQARHQTSPAIKLTFIGLRNNLKRNLTISLCVLRRIVGGIYA